MLKLPLLGIGWYVMKVIKDVPQPEFDEDDGGDFVPITYKPGPRVRGPEDGRPRFGKPARRGDLGHDEAPKTPQHKTTARAE